jgi:hypothetical protein
MSDESAPGFYMPGDAPSVPRDVRTYISRDNQDVIIDWLEPEFPCCAIVGYDIGLRKTDDIRSAYQNAVVECYRGEF